MTRAGLLGFCLRSLWREYGIAFLLRVVMRHPLLCWTRLKDYLSRSSREQANERPPDDLAAHLTGGNPRMVLVGLGFCLKPLDPECPSGRPNHDCAFFDRHVHGPASAVAPACRRCQIRILGLAGLRSGYRIYIMTSAKDILEDVLLPALKDRRFKAALLAICRYSFAPIAIALALVGLDARLVPFAGGDCEDYRTWRRADKGIKEDQTRLGAQEFEDCMAMMKPDSGMEHSLRISRSGNIYHAREDPERI